MPNLVDGEGINNKELLRKKTERGDDFFELVTSTKGYLSDFDITIASEGNF